MVAAHKIWHNLDPVVTALTRAGICWRNVGEVVAWNNYSITASAFVRQWRRSSEHWSLLTAVRYDRGGGFFMGSPGFNVATYYVLDLC